MKPVFRNILLVFALLACLSMFVIVSATPKAANQNSAFALWQPTPSVANGIAVSGNTVYSAGAEFDQGSSHAVEYDYTLTNSQLSQPITSSDSLSEGYATSILINGNDKYVLSCVNSADGLDVPGYDTQHHGGVDIRIALYDVVSNELIARTYEGGSGNDCAYDLALEGGKIYVAGKVSQGFRLPVLGLSDGFYASYSADLHSQSLAKTVGESNDDVCVTVVVFEGSPMMGCNQTREAGATQSVVVNYFSELDTWVSFSLNQQGTSYGITDSVVYNGERYVVMADRQGTSSLLYRVYGADLAIQKTLVHTTSDYPFGLTVSDGKLVLGTNGQNGDRVGTTYVTEILPSVSPIAQMNNGTYPVLWGKALSSDGNTICSAGEAQAGGLGKGFVWCIKSDHKVFLPFAFKQN